MWDFQARFPGTSLYAAESNLFDLSILTRIGALLLQ